MHRKSGNKISPVIASKENMQEQRRLYGAGVFWGVVFAGVLLFAIGFRIYKAHDTGILYDEVWTYEEFATDLHTALTNYDSTNNHILNSVFIVLTQKLFGGYEHYLRIPAVLFGILFCCAVAAILYQTVQSRLLRAVALLLILMNWFVSDLTYLGRGYAIALGTTFAGIAMLLYLHSDKGKPASRRWWVAVFLIGMNFLAVGSMLSSLSIVASINLIYGAWLIMDSARQSKKAVVESLVRLGAIAGGSILALFWLYYPVLSKIREQSKAFKVEPFWAYLGRVLWEPLIFLDFSRIQFNMLIYRVSVIMAVVSVVIWMVRYVIRRGTKMPDVSPLSAAAGRVVLLFVATMALMWMQSVVFGVSLGEPRNGVFLSVLMMLSVVVAMDQAIGTFLRVKIISRGLCLTCGVLMAVIIFLNWPSYHAVHVHPHGWAIQSAVGPLVRQLRQIDPDQTWRIKLTKDSTDNCFRPIRYYKQFGYHIELVEGDQYDVLILPKMKLDSQFICLDPKRFTEHHCCVVVNTASFQNKRVFYEMHILPPEKK
jgi:hypothetical protein